MRGQSHVHHQEAPLAAHVPSWHRRHAGAAAARIDGARGHRARPDGGRAEDAHGLHLHPARRDDGQVDAGGSGHGLSVLGDPAAARAVPRSRLRRQRSRARPGGAVERRRHRRRRESRARGGRVPERRASGQEERSVRRRDGRSDCGAARRPGHAASVDRAVDGAAEPDLRRRRLHLRLPQHAVVEVGDAAAADGEQPADRLRAAVRRRQHRRAAAGAAESGAQPARLDQRSGPGARKGSAGRRPPPAARVSRRGARDRAPRQAGGCDAVTRSRSAGCAGRHPGRFRVAPQADVRLCRCWPTSRRSRASRR